MVPSDNQLHGWLADIPRFSSGIVAMFDYSRSSQNGQFESIRINLNGKKQW